MKIFPKNKKGQGLSTNAIVLIVLGVLVMVMLIAGFALGWDKIAPWIKAKDNVDQVKQACELSCTTNAAYGFCFAEKELFTQDESESFEEVSCYYLSKKFSKAGIENCPSISCNIFDDLEKAKAGCKSEGEKVNYLGKTKVDSYTCLITDIM